MKGNKKQNFQHRKGISPTIHNQLTDIDYDETIEAMLEEQSNAHYTEQLELQLELEAADAYDDAVERAIRLEGTDDYEDAINVALELQKKVSLEDGVEVSNINKFNHMTAQEFLEQQAQQCNKPPEIEVFEKDFKPVYCLGKLKNLFYPSPMTQLAFNMNAWLKINFYVHLMGKVEVTGFGKIEKGIITDIKILPQLVGSVNAETLNVEDVSNFFSKIPRKEKPLWCLDWHSHVDGGITPSITDDDNYSSMYNVRGAESFPFLIINKKQNVKSSYYIDHKFYTDITVSVPPKYKTFENFEEFNKLYEECAVDIKNSCVEHYVEPSPVITKAPFNPNYKGHRGYPIRNNNYKNQHHLNHQNFYHK